MVSSLKKSKKRILKGIIISIVSAIFIAAILTKCIYDRSFLRYDTLAPVPAALEQTVQALKTVQFQSGKNTLTGYLYEGTREGLVILIPGYRAGGDDYLWQIQSLLDYGWGVFTFDPTGHCRSEGRTAVGFSQTILDLESALQYLQEQRQFGYRDLMLLGHSRGGYAACGMLDEPFGIDAVVTVSGANTCMDAVMQPAADRIGGLAYMNYPMLYLYQAALFGGEAVDTDAAREIAQSDIPVLVVQGAADPQMRAEKYSIYAQREQIPQGKAEYYLCAEPGRDGHTDLLYDADGTANDALMERIHRFFEANKGE